LPQDGVVAGLVPGLRVMVSAGASGIGRAAVEGFVRAGARVHICDVDQAALDKCLAEIDGVEGLVADVSDPDAVDQWFDAALDHLGGLDVMINNAGVAGPTGPLEELAIEDWRRTIDVDINGMYLCTRRAIPPLKRAVAETGEAVMINLSSIAGKFGFAYRTPYSASKWGVVGLTQSLSRELGPFGIRVNAIQPGPVAGERIDRVIAAKAEATGRSLEDVSADFTGNASLGRFVTAEDIANMILFLCTPQARNVSGQAIAVCAGSTDMT